MTDILTLASKEIYNFFKIWKQTIVPAVMTAVLYIIIFWEFLWSQISNIEGVPYINYIFPWLLLMWVIMWSYAITSFWFFSAKMFKSIEELLVSSITKHGIIIWYCIAWLTRWLTVWISIFLVSSLFIDFNIHSYFYIFIFTALTSLTFSLLGFFNAMFAKNFDDVNIIPNFVITPLIYLWWVFYSVSMLPDVWQMVSKFNPILYMINWLRFAFIWQSDVNIYSALIILISLIIILYLWVFKLLDSWYWIKS